MWYVVLQGEQRKARETENFELEPTSFPPLPGNSAVSFDCAYVYNSSHRNVAQFSKMSTPRIHIMHLAIYSCWQTAWTLSGINRWFVNWQRVCKWIFMIDQPIGCFVRFFRWQHQVDVGAFRSCAVYVVQLYSTPYADVYSVSLLRLLSFFCADPASGLCDCCGGA